MTIRAAVDIGGTFTDVIAFDDAEQELLLGKTLSTPHDLIEGVVRGLEDTKVALDRPELIIHGSTVVINALVERDGARAALITTEGFRDVYEIGRINRPDAFNLHFTKHRPLIPRHLVFEVPERMGADGACLKDLDEDRARDVARALVALGVEAVAVVFLHAYREPAHEIRMGEILRDTLPGCYVTLSHELTREYREFERTSTTAANAFVGPRVSDYLGHLEARLGSAGSRGKLAIMQSNGGVSDVDTARVQCVQMMESGPAGGVVGTIALCETLGIRQAITLDMGGTTAKAAVVRDLKLPLAPDYFVGGYGSGLPIRIPCLDIVEVGTGGGSVAWTDAAGGVHVGPRSAGADPGPACYGRGGSEATVTDASVTLGQLAPGGQLSGGLALDGRAARTAIERVAAAVGMEVVPAAAGILAIGAASMANAVRAVTTERGLDPRDFVLFAYGGNGPLHISLVARELGIRHVVVPPVPALFSALGMLLADVRRDVVRTGIRTLDDVQPEELETDFRALEAECRQSLTGGGIQFGGLAFTRAADMRYVGQEHTVTVSVPDDLTGLKSAFDEAHEQRFSHSAPEEPAQIVSLRVSAAGRLRKPRLPTVPVGSAASPDGARTGTRDVVFAPLAPDVTTPVYARSTLLAGNVIPGPAIIEEPTATTLLRPDDRLEVDPHGNLLLTIGATR